ncbi:MAG: VWA domain-containing protein [Desulfobacterales bacterium]|nr:VWA domain-containing protein [Desulfobacterales bacterium]
MLDLVLKFAQSCREAELRVSTAELIDCAGQLELIDMIDEDQFKATLRANFAKSRREQKNFDRLYHLFFHEMRPDPTVAPERLENGGLSKDLAELLDQMAERDEANPLDQAIMDFLAGDPLPYLREIQRIENQAEAPRHQLKSNLGQLSSRLEVMLRINRFRDRIRELPGEDQTPSVSSDRRRAVDHLIQRLNTANRMLTEDTRPYNEALQQVKNYDTHYADLGEKPFASLSAKEIQDMRDGIEELVRKLKDAVTRRYASRNKGMLDVKKTLRHAGRFQGVPVELKFKDRPLRKAKIVTLCDVSGSVWSAARFMLNMIYSLQDCFSDVKSFAFVCFPTNITDIFEKNEVNRAIEKVMAETDIQFDSLTDYGEVLYQFHRDHLHLLNRRTTLIIVGDGRSNYHNPREKLLEEIRAKCRRVIWLNPEPEEFWGTGDSEMNTYKAYAHEVRPCRNLNQLIDFIEDLVL